MRPVRPFAFMLDDRVPLFDVNLAHLAIFVLLFHGRISHPVVPRVLLNNTDPIISSSLIPKARDILPGHLQSVEGRQLASHK